MSALKISAQSAEAHHRTTSGSPKFRTNTRTTRKTNSKYQKFNSNRPTLGGIQYQILRTSHHIVIITYVSEALSMPILISESKPYPTGPALPQYAEIENSQWTGSGILCDWTSSWGASSMQGPAGVFFIAVALCQRVKIILGINTDVSTWYCFIFVVK